jgi:hypothetical protein
VLPLSLSLRMYLVVTLRPKPFGVLFSHMAKLMVLGRMLQFVSRATSSRLIIIRRSQRAFAVAVALVDLVRPITASASPCTEKLLQKSSRLNASPAKPLTFDQVGICSNVAAGAIFLSTLPQTAAAIDAFESGADSTAVPHAQRLTPLAQATSLVALAWLPKSTKSVSPASMRQGHSPFVRQL